MIAAKVFGGKRPYGYAFGGSGGAFRTISCIENTDGIGDGVVPYVLGSRMAIPNVFTVRRHAMRVLWDKFSQTNDALEPGGSEDMYTGLNQEEKEELQEVTKMRLPPKAWFAYRTMDIHALPAIYPALLMVDKKYLQDFWTVPGYLRANPNAPDYAISKNSIAQSAFSADVAFVYVGRNAGEGNDRKVADDYELTAQEKEMLTTINGAFHAKGKMVIAVLNIGGRIETKPLRENIHLTCPALLNI